MTGVKHPNFLNTSVSTLYLADGKLVKLAAS